MAKHHRSLHFSTTSAQKSQGKLATGYIIDCARYSGTHIDFANTLHGLQFLAMPLFTFTPATALMRDRLCKNASQRVMIRPASPTHQNTARGL
ncbi:hypothetical protein IAQ61_005637 [Plenodomus lingam]|uniref:uncharacterized protein n=1 Tax=Leptosphaeria maculans TaxID=5022 RepID=UPI0033179CF7|nr:hypothetical protein IAQ61_005637 [Plenodomus lingam]